jgi:hypothetical protein
MYVNRKSRQVFLAHMKTGSRAVRDILRNRGFESVYGHHGGPWHGRTPKFTTEPGTWWYEQDPYEFRYYTVVRNHFDIIQTFLHMPHGDQFDGIPDEIGKVKEFMRGRSPHFHHGSKLFKFVQEVPGVDVMSFECLAFDLNRMLEWGGHAPLSATEWIQGEPNKGFLTTAKPRLHYREYTSPELRAWIEDRFATEMSILGYAW